MTDAFITVSQGRPENTPEDGVHVLTLTEIKDPRTVTARQGPKAGQDIDLIDWVFATEDGREIDTSTSTASGPKSKMYAYLTALFGGKAPPVGTKIEKDDLVGRQVLGTVATDDAGWPRIVNLSALPNSMQPAAATVGVKPTNQEAVVPSARKPAEPIQGRSAADKKLPF